MAEQLKEIPGFSQGVRANAAARMVKLVQPICPNSKVDMIRTPEGRLVANPEADPTRQNCQRRVDANGEGEWWTYCEQQGHDPYYHTRVWYSREDTFDTDPETGEQVKTGERTVRHEDRLPNIAQVAAHIRVNSGKGAEFKISRRGFKRLKDMGYVEVCQLRNCQKPATIRSNFGLYCGQEHALLCAADAQGEFLTQIPGREFDLGSETRVRQKRSEGLAKAGMFADIRPYDGE